MMNLGIYEMTFVINKTTHKRAFLLIYPRDLANRQE